MDYIESFVRKRNIDFFLLIGEDSPISIRAKRVGITQQHAAKLLKVWQKGGLVKRTGFGCYERTEFGNRLVPVAMIFTGALKCRK